MRAKVASALESAFSGQVNRVGLARELSWKACAEKLASNAEASNEKRTARLSAVFDNYAEMIKAWREREVRMLSCHHVAVGNKTRSHLQIMIRLEEDRDGAVMQHGKGDQRNAVEKIANLVGLTVSQ